MKHTGLYDISHTQFSTTEYTATPHPLKQNLRLPVIVFEHGNHQVNIFIQENAFESVVCDKAAILSRPQWVKIYETR